MCPKYRKGLEERTGNKKGIVERGLQPEADRLLLPVADLTCKNHHIILLTLDFRDKEILEILNNI